MESTKLWYHPSEFIPEGLFWDLFDDDGTFPLSGTNAPTELSSVTDQVHSFTFEQMMDALNNQDVNIAQYKTRLWSEFGAASGNTLTDYNTLFSSYGH